MIRATITYVKAYADHKIYAESEYKFYYETLTLSEVAVVLLNKNLSDSFTHTDIAAIDMTKNLAHSFTFADSLSRTVTYVRSFSDAFTLDDIAEADKNFVSNKGNIATLADVLGFGLTKPLTETMTISDVYANLVAKVIADSFSFADSSALASGKNISDSYSFSDTQIYNLGKGVTDTIPMTEVSALNHSKIFTDAFTLDGSTLVNKNYYGVKGNVFSFADSISVVRIPNAALGNMVLGSLPLN